jgi:hypothetical protein
MKQFTKKYRVIDITYCPTEEKKEIIGGVS